MRTFQDKCKLYDFIQPRQDCSVKHTKYIEEEKRQSYLQESRKEHIYENICI